MVWVATALLLGACTATPEVQSFRPDAPIEIDGAYDDWNGRFTAIGGARNVGLALARNGRELLLCLATRDLLVGGMLQHGGFTLWFDPQGGKQRVLGLRVAPQKLEPGTATTPQVEIVFDGAEYGFQLATLSKEGPLDVRAASHADVVVYEMRLALGTALTRQGAKPAQVTLPAAPQLGMGLVATMPEFFPRADGETAPEERAGSGRRARVQSRVEPLELWVRANLSEAR